MKDLELNRQEPQTIDLGRHCRVAVARLAFDFTVFGVLLEFGARCIFAGFEDGSLCLSGGALGASFGMTRADAYVG